MKHRQLSSMTLILLIIWVGLNVWLPGEARAVGLKEDMDLTPDTRRLIPDPNKTRISTVDFIKGFNFSDVSDPLLYGPHMADYVGVRDVFDLEYGISDLKAKTKNGVMDQMSSDSGTILAMAAGTIAFLYFMPESVSKWSEDKKDLTPSKLWERYDDSLKNGPVWDHDKPEINYIGHPYFGAAYYTHAMDKNFTRLQALSYSFMMSACMYEYGLEAFFEDPSIQDLIVTPVAGALVGEVFITLTDAIRSNNDKVLGSKTLGSVCMFFLDPITFTLKPINAFNEKYSRMHMEANYYARSVLVDNSTSTSSNKIYDHRVGVEISIYSEAFSR